jgi:hypothetical protein
MVFANFIDCCSCNLQSLFVHQTFYFVGEPVLEALQGKPSFLLCCYENFGGAGLSSCMFVRTFHALIFSQGISCIQHLLDLKVPSNGYLKLFVSPSNASALFFFLFFSFFFSLKVLNQLNLPPETLLSLSDETGDLERARKPWEILPAGHKIGTPEPLFRELVYVLFYSTQ